MCLEIAKKVSTSGIPGMFNAAVAIETYAQIFEEEGALDELEAFASLNGPKHYRMRPNEERDQAGEDALDRAGRAFRKRLRSRDSTSAL